MRVAVVWLIAACRFDPAKAEQPRDAQLLIDTPVMIDVAPPDGLPDDLIAYYPMDSLPMIDATGHGHDGTCTDLDSACPTLGSGVIGSSYAFANERVDVTSGSDLRSDSGTVAAWLAFDTLPAGNACPFGAIYMQSSNLDTWQLCRNATDWIVVLQETGSGLVELPYMQPINAGDWHYVAIVWTPAACTFYVDGQLAVASPIGQLLWDPTGLFTFGADRLSSGAIDVPITGRIDELKIFNRDLSQTEIAAMMQQR
ncbi:MAG TPA: LamG domain-containing protein [Kofleriaceae bacterium]